MTEDEILVAFKSGKLSSEDVLAFYQNLGAASAPKQALSEGQKGLWLLHELDPASEAYNVPICFRTRSAIDIGTFQRAFERVCSTHSQLVSIVVEHEGAPYMTPRPAGVQCFWSEEVAGLSEDELRRRIEREAKRPFDLSRDALARAHVYRTAPADAVVLLVFHHIVFDGASAPVFLRDLLLTYDSLLRGVAVDALSGRSNYGDFVRWEAAFIQSEEGRNARAFWLTNLGGELPIVHLDIEATEPSHSRAVGASCKRSLSRAESAGVREFCATHGVQPSVLLLGVYQLLLNRYSGVSDLVVGVPSMGRPGEEFMNSVGYFVNMMPLRQRLCGERPFAEHLEQLALSLADAMDHAAYPFPCMVQDLKLPKSVGESPVFQVAYVFQNKSMLHLDAAAARAELPRTLEFVREISQEGEFKLMLEIVESADEYTLNFKYDASRYQAEDVASLQQHYRCLLASVLAAPSRAVAAHAMLSEDERARLLITWNQTARPFSSDRCLHELFESIAEREPHRPAVLFGDRSLSYGELNARADEVARDLRSLGVRADSVVGVCMERSLEMVVSIWAVLKAGGAYMPIEPSYPSARVQYMIENAGVDVVLTQSDRDLEGLSKARHVLRFGADARWRGGKDVGLNGHGRSSASQAVAVSASNLAYVIYTSGSTGMPKGVMVEHRAVVNRIEWMQNEYALDRSDVVLQKTPFSFDVSVWEFVWPLVTGARLVVAEPDRHKDPGYLCTLIKQTGVTVLHFVPPMLRLMLEHGDWAACDSLRHVFCSGDSLPAELVSQHGRQNRAKLHNLYGPTEAAIDVSYWACPSDGSATRVPIGKPIQNIQLYVLNEGLEPQPVGCAGQLFIAGVGLARGYVNDAALTRERFVPNPFDAAPGSRMYKTGDLVRWLADGNLEFLGRMDNQVKVRGFRVELEEIEAQLLKHPDVHSCVALAREDEPGNQRIVAYVVASRGLDRDFHAALVEHLSRVLPEYMIPSAFVVLEQLPVTANGKIDRKALPAPEIGAQLTGPRVAPSTETQRILLACCASLLGLSEEKISIEDDFFALGGHSLLIPKLTAGLLSRGLRCDVRSVFDAPSLQALAAVIDGTSGRARFAVPTNRIPSGCTQITPEMLPLVALTQEEIATLVRSVPGGAANVQDIYPLAVLQEGMLFHYVKESRNDPYVLSCLLCFANRVQLDRFVAALRQVVRRHDALRTAVVQEGLSRPVQVVYREVDVRLEELQLRPHGDVEEQVRAMLSEPQSIALERAPLLRLRAGKAPTEDKWFMVFNLHHIVDDATSLGLMFREIVAHMEHQGGSLPAPVPYRNFVAQVLQDSQTSDAQAFFSAQLGSFREPSYMFELRDVRGDGRSVVDYRRPLETSLGREIRARAKELRMSPASLFHAAWALVVAACSGRDDVVFGTVMSGRLQGLPGIERMLGNFINTLPVRVTLGERSVADLVRGIDRVLRDLIAHEQTPLSLAQKCSGLPPETSLFNAILNYRHLDGSERLDEAELQRNGIRSLGGVFERSNYPIALSVDDLGHGFSLEAQVEQSQDPELLIGYLEAAVSGIVDVLAAGRAATHRACDVDVLPASQRLRALSEWTRTRKYASQRSVHALFEDQAQHQPDAIAVVYNGKTLSYGELNAQANRLAHHLRSLGVGPERRVALCLTRSEWLVVSVLAVFKAGGAYVPLDPAYPVERLQHLLQDSAPSVLLSDGPLPADLHVPGLLSIDVRAQAAEWSAQPATNPAVDAVGLTPESLAYVIYTSGSTGAPKGVMVEHRNLTRLFAATEAWFEFERDDVWTLFHSFAFDFSVWEMWGALLYGGRLVVVPWEKTRNPREFYDLLCEERVTVLNQTPSAFRQLIAAQAESGRPHRLRAVIFGGEALELSALRPWMERDINRTTRLINMYGITETTVHVTYRPIDWSDLERTDVSPIGRPIPDLSVYVLDTAGKPAPVGATGELYVGGDGVSRGYLNRPELTAERFLSDPFRAGTGTASRMYRTGDLGRYRADGSIEYLGRNDQQIKIRGFRIELGEIEARLNQHPGVRDARVVARHYGEDDTRLVAYVVPSDAAKPVRNMLRLQQDEPEVKGQTYQLPNGLTIFHQNKSETDFVYEEIFSNHDYLRHGISLREGDCIFDVGANIGMFTLFAGKRCPGATIYAFEPVPPVFDSLRRNVALHGINAKVFQCGLAAEPGQETFTFYRHNTVISSSRTTEEEAHEMVKSFLRNQEELSGAATMSEAVVDELVHARLDHELFTCQLRTISELIHEQGVERIDLLKVDVENAEYEVLKGIQGRDWPKIQQLVVEVHDTRGRLEQILTLLQALGYDVRYEQDNRLLQNTPLYNVYAVRPQASERRGVPAGTALHDLGPAWANEPALVADVQAWLRAGLPDYMVPAAVVPLFELPLTQNGKLDTQALPAPESRLPTPAQDLAPHTEEEKLVADVWADVLQIDPARVALGSNFFVLGGNSLLVTRLVSRLKQKAGVELPIQSIFDGPTLKNVAAELKVRRGGSGEDQRSSVEKILGSLELVEGMSSEELRLLDMQG